MSLQLHVKEPCHENWNQMTPDEQGRFCNACAKTVIDFSMMTDQEVLAFFSNTSGNVCGRFTNDQLNRTIEEKRPKKYSWLYVWNMIVAASLFTVNAKAQIKKKAVKTNKVVSHKTTGAVMVMPETIIGDTVVSVPPDKNGNMKEPGMLQGIIKDKVTGLPIGFATITVKEIPYGLAADSSGRFSIRKTEGDSLEVSAIGYEAASFAIDKNKGIQEILLAPAITQLQPVAIVSFPTQRCMAVVGGATSIRKISTSEKIQRNLDALLPKTDVKVYPNPITPGSSLHVQLALKETGKYRLEILAENGTLIHAQSFEMHMKEQTISVPTGSNWSRGLYWLRISGQASKKIYHAKVLVQ